MLSPEVSSQLATMLVRMRDALLAQAPALGDAAAMSAHMTEADDAPQADMLSDDAARLSSRDDAELDRIYRALGRLELGEADVCIVCGELIPPARLLANPLADTCIRDQRDIERGEHLANPGGAPTM
jgi:DnaK suppressor protein